MSDGGLSLLSGVWGVEEWRRLGITVPALGRIRPCLAVAEVLSGLRTGIGTYFRQGLDFGLGGAVHGHMRQSDSQRFVDSVQILPRVNVSKGKALSMDG